MASKVLSPEIVLENVEIGRKIASKYRTGFLAETMHVSVIEAPENVHFLCEASRKGLDGESAFGKKYGRSSCCECLDGRHEVQHYRVFKARFEVSGVSIPKTGVTVLVCQYWMKLHCPEVYAQFKHFFEMPKAVHKSNAMSYKILEGCSSVEEMMAKLSEEIGANYLTHMAVNHQKTREQYVQEVLESSFRVADGVDMKTDLRSESQPWWVKAGYEECPLWTERS
jgi:hypothetical protein